MNPIYLLPLLVLSACAIYFEPEFNLTNETSIYQVIDGDTFILNGGHYVRLIGIDAPEKKQEGYHEATDFLRQFEGMVVILESEGDERDRYGRLLRHAYVDNQNLALLLLKNNHSVLYSEYNGTYYEEFLAASR